MDKNYINIGRAYLCEDCNIIFEPQNLGVFYCPVCAGSGVYPVQAWLLTTPEAADAQRKLMKKTSPPLFHRIPSHLTAQMEELAETCREINGVAA